MNFKITAAALCAATLLTVSFSTPAQAFDEIEDLSRVGTLGNKETFKGPADKWEQETILGKPQATEAQMVAYIRNHNPNPKISCSLEELVHLYYEEAGLEGVRADIALCQALKETAFFGYGHDVLPHQNNYCGLGAIGNGAHGYSFCAPRRGVRAHIQHLIAYAKQEAPQMPLADPRYSILVERYPQYHGAIRYWVGLNGRWAVPGTTYGQDILRLWHEALTY